MKLKENKIVFSCKVYYYYTVDRGHSQATRHDLTVSTVTHHNDNHTKHMKHCMRVNQRSHLDIMTSTNPSCNTTQ